MGDQGSSTEHFGLNSCVGPQTSVTTRVTFQSRAKTELPFDGDVGNLLQQNQTSAKQPDPPDSLVNPPVCSNRKHSPPQKNGKIRNTRVSDGGTHVKAWFDGLMRSFSSLLLSPSSSFTDSPKPPPLKPHVKICVLVEMCPSAVSALRVRNC